MIHWTQNFWYTPESLPAPSPDSEAEELSEHEHRPRQDECGNGEDRSNLP
jgi:hypothetical protein